MTRSLIYGLAFGWVSALVFPVTATAAPFAYVTNSASDTVSVIDTATDTVVTTIAVGDNPAVVAITPDGTERLDKASIRGDAGTCPLTPDTGQRSAGNCLLVIVIRECTGCFLNQEA